MAPKKKKKAPKAEGEEEEVDLENSPEILKYELQETRKSLESFRDLYVRQRRENEDLKASLSAREKEHFELINYLRQENERKDRVIQSLNESLKEQRQLLEKDHETVTAHFQGKMQAAEELSNKEKAALRHEIEDLTEKLEVLQKFQREKDLLQSELKRLRVQTEELQESHQDELQTWEQKFFDEKRRVQEEMKKIVVYMEKKSKEDAVSQLDDRTKLIMHEHAKMAEELRFQAEETEEMRQQRDTLDEERKRLQRDKSLHESTFMELAREGAVSKKQIRNLSNKVRLLEDSLKEVTKQNSEERQKVAEELQTQVEKSEVDATSLRRQLKLKTKELRHIRRLSQMILDQRSEVEQFFIEALEQVKLERAKVIEEERRQAKVAAAKALREHAGGPRSQKALSKAATAEVGALPGASTDKVYLKDLTLEDRERVLRLLFAKINIAHKATKPIETDFNDDEFDDGRAVSEPSEGGGFYVTQMDGDVDVDLQDSNEDRTVLPEIPSSRGSSK